jgi:hypothetical protein
MGFISCGMQCRGQHCSTHCKPGSEAAVEQLSQQLFLEHLFIFDTCDGPQGEQGVLSLQSLTSHFLFEPMQRRYSRVPEIVNAFVRRPWFTILRLFTIMDGQQTQAGQLLVLQGRHGRVA